MCFVRRTVVQNNPSEAISGVGAGRPTKANTRCVTTMYKPKEGHRDVICAVCDHPDHW